MKQATKALNLGLVALVYLFFGNGFAHADNIYVGESGNGTLEKVDSSGNVSVLASGLASPIGLTCDSSGNLYVDQGNTIDKFDPNGNMSVYVSSLSLNAGVSIAFDSSGNLYVGGESGGQNGLGYIAKVDSSKNVSVFASLLNHIGGLACDSSGNVYVSSYMLGSGTWIFKYDSSGDKSVFASGLSGEPTSLAFDSSGNLYVGCATSGDWGYIDKLDPSGNMSVFAMGLYNPEGIAFDSAGNLYMADYVGGTIDKFDRSGNMSVYASDLDNPISIAVPVPEPATWALLWLGAVTLFSGLRLRRIGKCFIVRM